MNRTLLTVLTLAAVAMPAAAADVPAGGAGTAQVSDEDNQKLYLAGEQERARMLREADGYARAEQERARVESAFLPTTPDGLMNAKVYDELRAKNAGFVRNVAYWKEQVRTMYPNLVYAVKVNDLETAAAILKHMRDDHYSIDGEVAAIEENNRKARAWPRMPTNQEQYEAGAAERASILAQAAAAADLEGRDVPESAFSASAPASVADKARYAALREKNAGFISNIGYWRNQLTSNHENLKAAVEANDLETARTLLDYMKKDSAALTNEIQAVQSNNAEAAGL